MLAERAGHDAASGDVVRAAAAVVAGRAADLDSAAARLEGAQAVWRGTAAAAVVAQRGELARGARVARDAWMEAAQALRVCAAGLDEAASLGQHAHRLSDRAAAARSVAAGPGSAAWHAADDAVGFATAAARCAADADEVTAAATRRAVAQLQELTTRRAAAHEHQRHHGQLHGFGHGALTTLRDLAVVGARTSPQRAFMDPVGFAKDEAAVAAGLLHSAHHPRQAFSDLLGLDQLRHGQYGEWAGSLLASTAVPGGRIGKLESLGGRSLVRAADRGGPVNVRAGLRLPAGFPIHIEDLLPHRRRHILDGDGPKKGGGHRSGTGKPGKTEFPPHWTDDDIISRVMQTAMQPSEAVFQANANFAAWAMHDGVKVKVVIDRHGVVLTAHPEPGFPGVVDNRTPRAQ